MGFPLLSGRREDAWPKNFERLLIDDSPASGAHVAAGHPFAWRRRDFTPTSVTRVEAVCVRSVAAEADPSLWIVWFVRDVIACDHMRI